MFSGDWNLRVGLEREEQPPRAAVQVWEERTVFVRLESAHCSRDRHTERLRTLVARLKLHLCVMLLIFEIDMPFHLLIKKKKQKNLKRKKKKDQIWICMPRYVCLQRCWYSKGSACLLAFF